eukprot:2669468-Rhodomonas_salina.7
MDSSGVSSGGAENNKEQPEAAVFASWDGRNHGQGGPAPTLSEAVQRNPIGFGSIVLPSAGAGRGLRMERVWSQKALMEERDILLADLHRCNPLPFFLSDRQAAESATT